MPENHSFMPAPIVTPLDFWLDPQGDVILIYSEHECLIYCACWIAAGERADFIGQLSFERGRGVRSYRREHLPYHLPKHECHSWILQIPDSDFVREHLAYRNEHYSDSASKQTAPNHYVVAGHDIYHEILANGFTASTILRRDITDPRLLRL
jgi:hypothetical protein